MSLWITRAIGGAIVGVFVFAVLINVPVDGWITLSAGSFLMSVLIATMQVLGGTAHYQVWRSGRTPGSRRATAYLVSQALTGFPIVCVVSFLSFAAAYAAFVAP